MSSVASIKQSAVTCSPVLSSLLRIDQVFSGWFFALGPLGNSPATPALGVPTEVGVPVVPVPGFRIDRRGQVCGSSEKDDVVVT